jgi:hypothetical protein
MLKEDKTGGKKFMDFGGEILPFAAANNIKVGDGAASLLDSSPMHHSVSPQVHCTQCYHGHGLLDGPSNLDIARCVPRLWLQFIIKSCRF